MTANRNPAAMASAVTPKVLVSQVTFCDRARAVVRTAAVLRCARCAGRAGPRAVALLRADARARVEGRARCAAGRRERDEITAASPRRGALRCGRAGCVRPPPSPQRADAG